MTTAPFLMKFPLINLAFPIATTSKSAWLHISRKFSVFLLHKVTRQLWRCSRAATGLPTRMLEPTTTLLRPFKVTPVVFINSKQPLAAHGTNASSTFPLFNWLKFCSCKPSTSLLGSTLFTNSSKLNFSGVSNGNCVIIPCTRLSSFNSSILSISWCLSNLESKLKYFVSMPIEFATRILFRMNMLESLRLPIFLVKQ